MELDDCYRLLDIDPSATDEELKSAHRDLTKVWHPDRFAHDPALQRTAQEKLKAINEAYDAIRAARAGGWGGGGPRPAPPVPRSAVPKYRAYAFACAFAAFAILVRRPTPSGLVIAAVLFAVTIYLIIRMRRAIGRESAR